MSGNAGDQKERIEKLPRVELEILNSKDFSPEQYEHMQDIVLDTYINRNITEPQFSIRLNTSSGTKPLPNVQYDKIPFKEMAAKVGAASISAASNYIGATMKDSDAMAGYKQVSKKYGAAKNAVAITGGVAIRTATSATRIGITATRGGAKAVGRISTFGSSTIKSRIDPKRGVVVDVKIKPKWTVKTYKIHKALEGKSKIVGAKGKSFEKKFKHFARTPIKSTSKFVVKSTVKLTGKVVVGGGIRLAKGIGRRTGLTSKIVGSNAYRKAQQVAAFGKRIAKANAKLQHKLMAPFRFKRKVKAFTKELTKKILLLGGGILLIFVILDSVLIAVAGALPSSSTDSDDGTVVNSTLQKTLNDIYNIQKSYVDCLTEGSGNGLSIPSGWTIGEIRDSDGNVISDDLSDYKTANGYELKYYTGPANAEYKDSVMTYTGDVEDGTETEFTFFGYAGVKDDLGSASDIDKENKTAKLIDVKGENKKVVVEWEYMNSTTGVADIDQKMFYSGIAAMSVVATMNTMEKKKDQEFFKKYMNELFNAVMNDATINIELDRKKVTTDDSDAVKWKYKDPDRSSGEEECSDNTYYISGIKITVRLKNGYIEDMMNVDPCDNDWMHDNGSGTTVYGETDSSSKKYNKWEGWKKENGEWNANHDEALNYYMDPAGWADCGIQLPGDTASALSDGEIEDIIEQTKKNAVWGDEDHYVADEAESDRREKLIRYALESVGRFSYIYGSGHGNVNPDANPPKMPPGLDCSGFVSLALYMGGADSVYNPRSCAALYNDNSYQNVSSAWASYKFSKSNEGAIKPGTYIVKESSAGTSTTSSNHVVIYIGYAKLEGDEEARAYCVECTTYQGVSGVQLSAIGRINHIRENYSYARDPFGN